MTCNSEIPGAGAIAWLIALLLTCALLAGDNVFPLKELDVVVCVMLLLRKRWAAEQGVSIVGCGSSDFLFSLVDYRVDNVQ